MDHNVDQEIRKKLKEEEKKRKLNEQFGGAHHPYAEAAVIFFGTLGLLYFLAYLVRTVFMFSFGTAVGFLGVSFNWVSPIVHGLIWIAAIYSVYRKRSIIDDWHKRL